jgi:hypothetical protein
VSWRNIVRELSEGLLGRPEHDRGRSAPVIPANSPAGRPGAHCQWVRHPRSET